VNDVRKKEEQRGEERDKIKQDFEQAVAPQSKDLAKLIVPPMLDGESLADYEKAVHCALLHFLHEVFLEAHKVGYAIGDRRFDTQRTLGTDLVKEEERRMIQDAIGKLVQRVMSNSCFVKEFHERFLKHKKNPTSSRVMWRLDS
jgi:hypothetical protein